VSYLSRELVAGLTGRSSLRLDRNILMPLSFHLGYHRVPFDAMPGFGHVGLGGSLGWADPASGLAFAFVHNRLPSPFVQVDHAGFVAIGAMLRRGPPKPADTDSSGWPISAPHFPSREPLRADE
jgi:CubicO group peptidase (beta-lactamase class C family)